MPERWRDIAGGVGRMEPGPRNAITDVPGVRVGHSQAASGHATGITVVEPGALPAAAGVRSVNGVGELTAKFELEERGMLESPVFLCGTHAVGTVVDAAVRASGRGPDDVFIPCVGECNDGPMADSRTIVGTDVEAALGALGQEVDEGTVGAGTGMTCFDFPGGIGTASRRVGDDLEYTVGVLILANFGDREYLDLMGTNLEPAEYPSAVDGSCITVCATDAPMSANQLRRLALRPLLGLVRAGSYASEGSGEIGMAFGPYGEPGVGLDDLSSYFAAAWEAGWEAVLNCLVAARPGVRLDGTMQDAFPVEHVRRLARERSAR